MTPIFDKLKQLSRQERFILVELMARTNEDGETELSQRSLSDIVGVSRRQVSNAITHLTEMGILEQENVSVPQACHLKCNMSTLYSIFVPQACHLKRIPLSPPPSLPPNTPITTTPYNPPEKDKEKPSLCSPPKKFKKPTIDEIRAYISEKGYDINAQQFFDHYEMVGWVYGKSNHPIKDWKACVRTWVRTSNKTSAVNTSVGVVLKKQDYSKTHF